MALDSYTALKTAIADHLDRSDLTSQIDDFIDLAESRHKREIRIREMLTVSTLAIASGVRSVDLPDGFLSAKYFRLMIPNSVGGMRYYPNLYQEAWDRLTQLSVNDTRRPRAFAILDAIHFDSETDQAYSGELVHYSELDALSDSVATNALLDRAPDAYLYGALMASAPFLVHDERIATWGALYRSVIEQLNTTERASLRAGPMISRVSVGRP